MTPHETALVTVLLERLKMTDSPDKDPEAETLIRQITAEQPDATYHLVQTLIQDLSLHVAQSSIRIRAYRLAFDPGGNRRGEAVCTRLDAEAAETGRRSQITEKS